jgi:predicted nucleic acid-binding protein
MVVTEVCYLLAHPARGTPELAATFLDALAAGSLPVDAPAPADFARAAHLVRRYADLPLDAVDAAVVATAERLGATKVATVDRKDFRIVAPAHCPAFELLPADLG